MRFFKLKNIKNIILSRTDSIGDMILALPMAKVLKERFPGIKIAVLGRTYTRAVAEACDSVDVFIDFDDFMSNNTIIIDGKPAQAIIHVKPESYIAKRAKALQIPLRIGTANRLYHWFTCNCLVPLTRKRSHLHEAQLNLKLLAPFGIKKTFSYKEIWQHYALEKTEPLAVQYLSLFDKNKYNLILHPMSRGSAREWGIENYVSLVRLLNPSKYNIIISGTEAEKERIQPLFEAVGDKVINITGQISLPQFLSFVAHADGLVACSTGPLHVAAAMHKDAFGLYAPLHKICAGRWGPIGSKAEVFEMKRKCTDCAFDKAPCHCIKEILPQQVQQAIENRQKERKDSSLPVHPADSK